MNRMPPPEGPPGPMAPGMYEQAWRTSGYPQAFEGHAPESRRPSASAQPPLHPGYPAMTNRELPQLPVDGPGPYNRPGPVQPLQESPPAHGGYRPPINGIPHDASPHSAPPDYRSRMGFETPPQPSPNDATPPSGPPQSASQFIAPAHPAQAAAQAQYDPSYYQNPAYGARRAKASRAQQVSHGRHHVVMVVNDGRLRRVTNVEQGKPSVTKVGRLAVIAKKTA